MWCVDCMCAPWRLGNEQAWVEAAAEVIYEIWEDLEVGHILRCGGGRGVWEEGVTSSS